ncbi:hypothetical protein U1Q18_031346 [Sarracenia purpurea var. burkii]
MTHTSQSCLSVDDSIFVATSIFVDDIGSRLTISKPIDLPKYEGNPDDRETEAPFALFPVSNDLVPNLNDSVVELEGLTPFVAYDDMDEVKLDVGVSLPISVNKGNHAVDSKVFPAHQVVETVCDPHQQAIRATCDAKGTEEKAKGAEAGQKQDMDETNKSSMTCAEVIATSGKANSRATTAWQPTPQLNSRSQSARIRTEHKGLELMKSKVIHHEGSRETSESDMSLESAQWIRSNNAMFQEKPATPPLGAAAPDSQHRRSTVVISDGRLAPPFTSISCSVSGLNPVVKASLLGKAVEGPGK